MTVSNESNRTSAVGTGAEQTVPFTFPITANSDIVVTSRIITTGGEVTMVETTDYTVVNNGSSGGSITTVTPFIASTLEIHIVRDTPNTQITDLQTGGAFNADNVEDMSDKTTKLTIENVDALSRIPQFPTTDPASSIGDYPNSVDRAGLVSGWDANGKPTALSVIPEGSVAFSAIGIAIAEASDAASERNILEVGTADDVEFAEITGSDLIVKSPWHDVRAYGAVGDGLIDDQAAFVAAIAAMSANDTLYIPDGTYLLDSTVPITKSMKVRGNGKGSIVKSGSAAASFTVTGGTELVWENFVCDGASTGGAISVQADLELFRMDVVTVHDAGIVAVHATLAGTFDRLEIINCTLKDCFDGIRLQVDIDSALVSGNLIDTITSTGIASGIWLGNNTFALQDNYKKMIITNNVINNVTSTAVGAETHAIICYGREVIIKDNIVDTVSNATAGVGGDEAIYGKARFCTIKGNIVTDGGRGPNGAIAIKGSMRGVVTSPNGYARKVIDNVILEVSNVHEVGIFIQNENVLVEGNYIEGLSGVAIQMSQNDTIEWDDIAVNGNTIINHKGAIAISLAGQGEGIVVKDNIIRGFGLASTDTSRGISVIAIFDPFTDICISGNYIQSNDDSTSTVDVTAIYIGIQEPSGAPEINNLTIQNNVCAIVSTTVDAEGITFDIRSDVTADPAITGLVLSGNNMSLLSGHNEGGTQPLKFNTGDEALISAWIVKDNAYPVPTLTDASATPSVLSNDRFISGTTGVTITDLLNGWPGQRLTILSKGAIVFDKDGANINCGSADITTAAGDITTWFTDDGTAWYLTGFVDISADNSGGA
jgi:hypothetical protein